MSSLKSIKTWLVQSKLERSPKKYIVDSVIPTLGTGMQNSYGWTISLPDNYKCTVYVPVFGKLKKMNVRWDSLNPSQQIHYFRDLYLPKVVAPLVDAAIAVPEFNKKGNVHFHLLCLDSEALNDYDLACIRKTVLQKTMHMHGGSPVRAKALNYIHFLNNLDEWVSYLGKDLDKHVFPILTIYKIT